VCLYESITYEYYYDPYYEYDYIDLMYSLFYNDCAGGTSLSRLFIRQQQ